MTMTNQNIPEKGKIQWLAILQGLCMVMVVIDHIRLCQGEIMPWSAALNNVIESYAMELFMFISGWLFYHTCIRKEKTYKEVVRSKFIRLGIPFLVFTVAATLVKLPLPFLMHRPVDAEELDKTYILFRSNPLKEMWFINTLLEIMLLYPLFRLAVKNRWTALVALLVGLAMYYFFPKDIYNFRLNYVRWMLVYFTAGILACRYRILERLNGWWCIIVSGALFAALYYIELVPHRSDLPLSFAGIAFTVAVCRKIAEHCPSLFSSFRDYTYQIFLMAIFLQMPIRWLFSALHQNWLYLPLYAASLLIGIYVPTMIAKALQKKAPHYVRVCFGLS